MFCFECKFYDINVIISDLVRFSLSMHGHNISPTLIRVDDDDDFSKLVTYSRIKILLLSPLKTSDFCIKVHARVNLLQHK